MALGRKASFSQGRTEAEAQTLLFSFLGSSLTAPAEGDAVSLLMRQKQRKVPDIYHHPPKYQQHPQQWAFSQENGRF